jgi:predicted AlkP superfamily phosphohydrolase/phosphomutase
MGRVIIIGMDGADPDLLFPWALDGHLPNLGHVLRGGAYGRLESTVHPLTPQAWTSMITGVNPGRHGIFDFGEREEGRYDIRLVTSRDRAFPTIFEYLPPPLTCGLVNIPLAYPVDPVRGFAVGDMHTPSLASSGAAHPPEIISELDGYIIDVMAHWYEDRQRFLEDVDRMHEARRRTCLRLFDKYRPDIFFPVYVSLDRVQHAFWGEMTPRHRAEPGRHGGFGDAIFQTARKLDIVLGDYLERLGPEDHLLLVSDHGFGDLKGDVYLNSWLIENGYLRFDSEKVRAFRPEPAGESADRKHNWHRKLFAGDAQPLPSSDEDIRQGRIDPRFKTWDTVDWKFTRAYASGLFGNLWINLKGREPCGVIEPGRDYESLRDELISGLGGMLHPSDGKPLVSLAARREELYWGAELDRAPDIVVAFRDYEYITRGATEFLSTRLVSDVVVGHTGNHRRHGIVALFGAMAASGRVGDSGIMEIAPTILRLAGAPIPENLDASVASRLFAPEALKENPPVFRDPVPPRSVAARATENADMAEVLRRLQGLGYLV